MEHISTLWNCTNYLFLVFSHRLLCGILTCITNQDFLYRNLSTYPETLIHTNNQLLSDLKIRFFSGGSVTYLCTCKICGKSSIYWEWHSTRHILSLGKYCATVAHRSFIFWCLVLTKPLLLTFNSLLFKLQQYSYLI